MASHLLLQPTDDTESDFAQVSYSDYLNGLAKALEVNSDETKMNTNHDARGRFGSGGAIGGSGGGGAEAVMTDTVDREGVNGSVWSIISVRVNDKKVGEMEMKFNPQTQSYQVREVKVDEAQRGKDLGKELYKAGMIHAVSKGVGFTSDFAVSRSADNVWSSLKKAGWPVRKHEGAVLRQGEEKWHVERLKSCDCPPKHLTYQ